MLIYQKASGEDAQEIKELLKKTWTIAYAQILSPETIAFITSHWHKLEFLQEQINNPHILFFVAKENNKIVGMCNTDKIENVEIINIQRLHVLPEAQGQGIGSTLMNEVMNNFPKAQKIHLEVAKKNHKARSFYEHRGFRNVGEKTFNVAGAHLESFIMEKVLQENGVVSEHPDTMLRKD